MPAQPLASVKGLFAQRTLYNVVRELKRQRPATGRPQSLSALEQAVPTVENLSSKRVRVEHVFARLKVFRVLANSHFHHSRIAEMATVILNWLIR